MAKLPEYYAEEKAKKALERQEKKAEKAKNKKELTDEDVEKLAKEKAAKQIAKTKKKKESEPLTEITNVSRYVRKKELKELEAKGKINYRQYTKEDKTVKECVEKVSVNKKGETVVKSKQNVVRFSEKAKKYYNDQNQRVINYFYKNESIPKYTKYICSCCSKFKNIEEFHRNFSFSNLGRADESSQFHQTICKDCSQKLFYYHYYHNANKKEELAMERWCCDTNTYWDIKYFIQARQAYDNNPLSKCIIPDYIAAIGRGYKAGNIAFGATYWDSPSLVNRVYADNGELKDNKDNVVGEFKAPLDWSKEEVKLRKKIVAMLRYDPFAPYPEEAARKMYYDFDLMIDESMTEDILKLKAAVEIVCSHYKIEQLRLKEIELEQDGASDSEIKPITERRMKELKQITDFSKENGFSERYATKKAKGAGTLTGVMNEMREKMYEPGLVDYYSVKTCKEMEDVAKMSMMAIMDQLNLRDNEAWGMVSKQTLRIEKLTAQVQDLTEKLRKKEIDLASIHLVEEAKKHNIDLDDEEENKNSENKEKEETKDPELDNYLNYINSQSYDDNEDIDSEESDSDGY